MTDFQNSFTVTLSGKFAMKYTVRWQYIGRESLECVPLLSRLGVWWSVVNFRSRVWGGAIAANDFGACHMYFMRFSSYVLAHFGRFTDSVLFMQTEHCVKVHWPKPLSATACLKVLWPWPHWPFLWCCHWSKKL